MKLKRIFPFLILFFIYSFSFVYNLSCENLTQVIPKNTPEIISLITTNIDSFQDKTHSCIDTLMKYLKRRSFRFLS